MVCHATRRSCPGAIAGSGRPAAGVGARGLGGAERHAACNVAAAAILVGTL